MTAPPGHGHLPIRVALDMTFPRRSPTWGFSVYARSLAAALRGLEDVEPLEIAGPAMSGFPATMHWLAAGARRAARSSGAALLHCPAFVVPWHSPVPIVITIHDAAAFLCPDDYPREWRLYNRLVLPRLARRAQGIIAVSAAARADVARAYCIPADQITVTLQGIRDIYFSPPDQREVARLRHEFGADGPLLLFAGAPLSRKNLPLVLRAMAQAPPRSALADAHLLISGATEDRFTELRAWIAAHGLAGRVRWIGPVAPDAMPATYAAVDALVYPSFYEGFGLPPLEAMAVGTPVVASAASCLPEILGDAALLVNPHDVEAFGAAVEAVLTRPGLRETLAARGRERAGRYRWRACAEATARVYRRALGLEAPGSRPCEPPALCQGAASRQA